MFISSHSTLHYVPVNMCGFALYVLGGVNLQSLIQNWKILREEGIANDYHLTLLFNFLKLEGLA